MSGTPFNLFEELREEWRTRGVGDQVLAEIETQFESVARRHPVRRLREFADDDGLRDLTQKFHLHLAHGRLDELFAHAGDLEHLRLLLRARGRQFLSNERRHLDFENVRKRAFEMLEADPHFTHADRAGGRCWTLAGRGDVDRFAGDPVELGRFARSLATPASVRTLRRDTSTSSRMISDPDLRALLRDICGKAPWALGAGDLIQILRERLGAWEVETLSLSRELAPGTTIEDLRGLDDPGFEAAEVRMLAEDARALLSVRQLIVLGQRYGEKRTREQVARTLGVGTGTVDNEARRAASVLLGVASGDFRVAGAVLGELLDRWNTL